MKADLAEAAGATACSGAGATATARAAYWAKIALSAFGKCGKARKQLLGRGLAARTGSGFAALAKGAPQLEFAAAIRAKVFVDWHFPLLLYSSLPGEVSQ